MAKMIKDTAELLCPTCGQKLAFVRVIKTYVDASKSGDQPFKGMIRRCKCGSFDKQGVDQKALVG